MVYTTGVAVQVYMDNTMVVQESDPDSLDVTSVRNGHIVLGRYRVNSASPGFYGKLTVDWLTIWDRPLTQEERNLVYQD